MAVRVFLGSGDSFTAASNNLSITGASGAGSETVLINTGITGTTLDANVERVDVAGNLSDYKFVFISGTGFQIQTTAGTVVGTIPSLNQNTTVAFADGSATLSQTGASTFTLGGQTVATGTAATITSTSMGTGFNTAVKTGVTSTGSGTGSTSSVAFTENVDNVVGTANNDTLDASLKTTVAGRLQTWNNADQIDGAAGTDTLFAQLTAGVTAASFKNVEILDIEAQANLTVDLNTGDAALTTIKSSNSGANALTVQNIQSAPTNYALTNTTGNLTSTVVNTKLAGTADAATLDLNNVTAGTVTLQPVAAGSGYETITVNSNGSVANTLTSLTDGNGTTLTTVNVAGAQQLTVTLADTTVTTVNASTMTGVLNLTVAAGNTQNMAITGGSGNDVISTSVTYTSADTINGGAGTDRLVLSNGEAVAATTTQANVSNVEVIGLSDGLNGAVTVNNFGATGLRFGAAMMGAGTVNYAAGTAGLDLQANASAGNALTATMAGTATNDVMNITMGSLVAGNTFGTGNVTINGAETVNLLSQGGANTFGGTFTITDTAATQALVITGSQNITFTGAVRADTVDASGMTGAATLTLTAGTSTTATSITGTANADSLTGSSAGDIINGGAGADTIANVTTAVIATAADVLTGGAGFDTFILRGDLASGAVATILNQAPLITDFTVGSSATTTDILQLSATRANYSAAGTAFAAGVAAAAAGSTTIQTVAQNAGATAYITGTDLIKLTTGVATTGLTLQQAFNAAIGTGTVTGLTASDQVFFSLYDTTNGRMEIGIVNAAGGTNTVVETADVVTLVGSITMSATDYANFSTANLSVIAG